MGARQLVKMHKWTRGTEERPTHIHGPLYISVKVYCTFQQRCKDKGKYLFFSLFNKGGERMIFFNKWCWNNWISICKDMNFDI